MIRPSYTDIAPSTKPPLPQPLTDDSRWTVMGMTEEQWRNKIRECLPDDVLTIHWPLPPSDDTDTTPAIPPSTDHHPTSANPTIHHPATGRLPATRPPHHD